MKHSWDYESRPGFRKSTDPPPPEPAEEPMPPVVVIFRVDKEGICFALFPELPGDPSGGCVIYEHIGQHHSGPYGANVDVTRPAKPEEYADLKRELEGIGYNLKVRNRWTRRRT